MGLGFPFVYTVYYVVGNVNGLHLDSKLQKIGCPIAISFMVNDSFIFNLLIKDSILVKVGNDWINLNRIKCLEV